jgi:hypothetical protein
MSATVHFSQSIENLTKALNKFHRSCPKIPKSCKNPFLKSKYADLSTILDIVQPVLNECELVVQQHPTSDYGLTTIISHTSGEWMSSEYRMQPLESVVEKANAQTGTAATKGITPQSIGSVITYQRRYALGAILALNIDDDNDGNPPDAAAQPEKPKKTTAELMAEAAAKVETPKAETNDTPTLEITQKQRELIGKLFDNLGITAEQQLEIIKKRGVQTLRSFTYEQAGTLIAGLEKKIRDRDAVADTTEANTLVGKTELNMNEPKTATAEQVTAIKSAISAWAKEQPGVDADFIARLQAAGFAKIADLSFNEARDLYAAIYEKNMAIFFDHALSKASA